MPESTQAERLQEWLDSPYRPEMGTGVDTQARIAKALEYSAYHLYQISQKLDQVIDEIGSAAALGYLQSSRSPGPKE